MRSNENYHVLKKRMNQYAQELNNSAASCIEIGLYPRAVSSLIRALKLSKHTTQSTEKILCQCPDCTLDECTSQLEFLVALPDNCGIGKRNPSTVNAVANGNGCNISHKPIRVSCQGQSMGQVLTLIIGYNLALAKHLSVVSSYCKGKTSRKERKRIVHSVLSAYRFIYKTIESPVSLPYLRSIRFEMILLNNICELYRLDDDTKSWGNPTSTSAPAYTTVPDTDTVKDYNCSCNIELYEHYRRLLLLTTMLVVDHNLISTSSGSSTDPMLQHIPLESFLQTAILTIFYAELHASAA